jgi:excisionase family DNA binding protein
MQTIQFIGTSPTELASLIADGISKHLENLNRFNPSSEKDSPKEVMTRKETAELFSVSTVTIHDWVNSGIIKPYKVGNRTYFKRSELLSVMELSNKNECAL